MASDDSDELVLEQILGEMNRNPVLRDPGNYALASSVIRR